jgi:hypothetical protein
MFIPITTRRLALVLSWAAPALAAAQQPHAGHAAGAPSAAASAPAAASTAATPKPASRRAGGYRSAFDGYRGFEDAPPVPWREANDNVGRIGGWRAYAREAGAANREADADGKGGHDARKKP